MAALINFSGIASGIDSSALIKAILDQQRTARIKPLEDQITALTDTNNSFNDLTELLGKFNTSIQKFRSLSGGVVAKQVSTGDETVLSATASNAAVNATYSVNVTQTAKNATGSFDDRYSSTSSIINSSINNGASAASRTVTISIGSGADQEDVDIEIDNTTTLESFVSQFNSTSTSATASAVNVGTSSSPSYALVFTSNNQGTSLGDLSFSVGSEITSAGSGAFASSTINHATDATFTVSGITGTITRSTNSVSDVIAGVTLNLQAIGSTTLTVGNNNSATISSLQDFVDAYNEIVSYVDENDAVTQQGDGDAIVNIFGSLANTAIDDNLLSALRSAFTGASTSGRSINTLADLGITTQRDGTLKLDTDVLEDALASDPEGVRIISENLGETLGAVGGTIDQFTRFGGLIGSAQRSNSSQITSFTNRISDIEKTLSNQEQTLTSQFARLESLIGQLQSQQSQLASILPK